MFIFVHNTIKIQVMRYFVASIGLLSVLSLSAFDQSDKVYSAIESDDYVRADSLLGIWDAENSTDPELFVAKFNRYINESRHSFIALTDDVASSGEALMFTDSTGNVVGSLREGVEWNDAMFERALEVIEDGIRLYPDRLDMRFGCAAALSMRDLDGRLLDELKSTLKYGEKISYRWLWTGNEKLEKPVQVMLDGMWDYCTSIYNSEKDELAFELSEALLKYFPDELKFINLCGAIKYLEGSYEDALAFFNKALALSPDDDIVIGNIAQVNFALGRFDEVEKLCDQVLSRENADPEMVKFVRDLKAKAQDRR